MSTTVKKASPKPAKKRKAPRKSKPAIAPRRELRQEEIDQIWRADEAMRVSSNLDREQFPHRFR